MRKGEVSFLEKFSGKMSKMGKQGISGILDSNQRFVPDHSLPSAEQAKKRPSIYRNKPTSNPTLSLADQQHQVNLDTLLPSHLPPKAPTSQNRKLSNIAKSNYVPSFTKQRSRNYESLEPLTRDERRNTNKDTPSVESRYQKTRESIISVKTTQAAQKNKALQSYGLSLYQSERQRIFGFTNKMEDDVAKHLEFLNSVEKKLSAKH